jgi:hypothetical protein
MRLYAETDKILLLTDKIIEVKRGVPFQSHPEVVIFLLENIKNTTGCNFLKKKNLKTKQLIISALKIMNRFSENESMDSDF